MDFPYGHRHHHRHDAPDDDCNPNRNPYGHQPPPRPFDGGDYPPPPENEGGYWPPPEYPPPPEAGYPRPGHGGGSGELPGQRTVRIYTMAAEEFSLSIRDGEVVLVPSDPTDEYQHWIKDMKYSTRVKDAEGCPSFALVNKATGEAIKHAIGATHPVSLVPYNPDNLDFSVLWAESKDTGEGFRCIRMVSNIDMNFDAFHGDDDHGGVRDGTPVHLYEWFKGKNQRWKIVPY